MARYPDPRTPAFLEWVKKKLNVRDFSAIHIVDGPDRKRIAVLVELPRVLDVLDDCLRQFGFTDDGAAMTLIQAWRLPDPPLRPICDRGLEELATVWEWSDLGDAGEYLWHAFREVGFAVGSTPVDEIPSREYRWSRIRRLIGPRKGGTAAKAKKSVDTNNGATRPVASGMPIPTAAPLTPPNW